MTSLPSSSSSHSKLTMKLLVDANNDQVLFAEASKAVVDFLFNLLHLPLGTVAKLMEKNGMLAGIGNAYHSLENLPEKYILPSQQAKRLLNPDVKLFSHEMSVLLPTTIGKSSSNSTAEMSGVVKDGFTFLVMDDLVIQPIRSVIEVVKKFNIKENHASLKEMVVELGVDEGIKLLKASLESKMVLTSVFVNKKILICDQ